MVYLLSPPLQINTRVEYAPLPLLLSVCTPEDAQPSPRVHVATRCVQVLLDEGLAAKADQLGEYLRQQLRSIGSPRIGHIRGKGLLNAIIIQVQEGGMHPVCRDTLHP